MMELDQLMLLKIKIDTIKHLEEVCQAIYKSEKKYKYIAIDTVTRLEEWCEWGGY